MVHADFLNLLFASLITRVTSHFVKFCFVNVVRMTLIFANCRMGDENFPDFLLTRRVTGRKDSPFFFRENISSGNPSFRWNDVNEKILSVEILPMTLCGDIH